MASSDAKDGVRRRGGALFGELRKLELLHENGTLSDASYEAARARLMRSISDADVVGDETPQRAPQRAMPAAAPSPAGTALMLGAAGGLAVAMIGASPEVLVCICLLGVAAAGFATCWEA